MVNYRETDSQSAINHVTNFENNIAIIRYQTKYEKYYLGYLEILTLKEEARELWGENYSDYNFHKFLLDYGPADFTFLHERLTE